MNNLSKSIIASLVAAVLCLPSFGLMAEEQNQSDVPVEKKSEKKIENKINADDIEDEDEFDFKFDGNQRDGFFLGMSAISSSGDDFYKLDHDNTEPEFDIDVSFRLQIGGLFVESPGLSSRRLHGLYATPAWGINFFNSEIWSLDLFYETSTKGIEGLSGILNRKKDKRGGLRATGYFDNSQLQAIFTPVSSSNDGSDGLEASLSYGYNWQVKNWNLYANVGMHYRSKEIADYLPIEGYSQPDENYSAKDGISQSAEIGLEYPLSEDWVFGSYVAYSTLSNRMADNRSDGETDGYRAGLLLTFVF